MSPQTKRLMMEGVDADTLDALVDSDSTWHSGVEHEVSLSDVEVETGATEDDVTLGSSMIVEAESVSEMVDVAATG